MKPSALNNQVNFLLIDLDAALTFMDIAETTGDEEIRQRNFRMLGMPMIPFRN
jgi:hypothetical protein